MNNKQTSLSDSKNQKEKSGNHFCAVHGVAECQALLYC